MTDIEYLNKYLPEEKLEDGLNKLKQGIPVQYIVGDINFYGFNIKVNPNVLIPRPETELLVEKTINYIKNYFGSIHVKVIDLGTGSGAIAIALKKNLNCSVTAVDISNDALDVARENACLNAADITFYEGDMLENITDKYDVIISNPPYISYYEKIEDIVKNNEPSIALFADNNGLMFYEKILSKASKNLNKKAIIAFEIGRNQGEAVKKIAKKYFPDATIKIEKDYPGEDRFVFIFI